MNSAAMAWRAIYCAYPLQTMQVQSIVTFNTVQRLDLQEAKADLEMNTRDKRTGMGLGLDTMVHHLRRIARA
jgi:hypothetical protein